MNRLQDIKLNLHKRAAIVDAVRDFFKTGGFLEVDTPVRNPVLAVEAHVEPFESMGWYLQTSPEICMKRLVAAGYQKIFQIAKCFRQHERGDRHLPEMSLLEWYAANAGYESLMVDCENLLRHVADKLGQKAVIDYAGYSIDLNGPWERLTLEEAFKRHAKVSLEEAVAKDCFEEVLSQEVEPNLGFTRPVFIYAYPKSMGSLARPAANNPKVVERFELYVAGIELANAFGELTDAAEQKRRFINEQAVQQKYGRTVMPLPQKFLDDLAQMPPCAGIALGLDRLVMLFCNAKTIDEITAFTPEEL